jgi:Uma2 family endonuclease
MSTAWSDIRGEERLATIEPEPRRRLWTPSEYERIVEAGLLPPGERAALIDGTIIVRRGGHVEPRRWSGDEYERLAAVGVLGPEERVELIDGVVFEMSPQNGPHASEIVRIGRVLTRAFGRPYHLRPQLPLKFAGEAEPEPDLAVVVGSEDDYEEEHPAIASLVVEVSDRTLAYDRGLKASIYARAGVPDYWIADLVNHRLEVRRDPVAMPGAPLGCGYASVRVLLPKDIVVPLELPGVSIRVARLLPKRRARNDP